MPRDQAAKSPTAAPRQVKLPRHRLRSLATRLHSLHRTPPPPPASTNPITIVCLSNTHGTQPSVPPGDLLLHAGDLTQWGTFNEIQAQLTWLSQQPHKYKVVIAGNHDLLLDPGFRHQHPQRWKQAIEAATLGVTEQDEQFTKIAEDVEWGDINYLQNSTVKLAFASTSGVRTLSVYGSPLTPKHGLSAFQHPVGEDAWTGTVPQDTDILLTHGPPWGHLDGVKHSGCTFLAKEVARVRPRLVVFGHIHVGYGAEERVYDGEGRAYEGILGGWGGWSDVGRILGGVLYGRLVPRRWRGKVRKTEFVNAAVVEGGGDYKVKNEAMVFRI